MNCSNLVFCVDKEIKLAPVIKYGTLYYVLQHGNIKVYVMEHIISVQYI